MEEARDSVEQFKKEDATEYVITSPSQKLQYDITVAESSRGNLGGQVTPHVSTGGS